jgi:aldose 1-epimerase
MARSPVADLGKDGDTRWQGRFGASFRCLRASPLGGLGLCHQQIGHDRRQRKLTSLTQIVEIADGDSLCRVAPGLGGSIVSWTVAGQPMLRTASKEAITQGNRLGLSSFPLVPYSNRIGNGRFNWRGKQIQLTPNFAPEPHAIHGTGWEDRWQVESHCPSKISLTLDHRGGARWPWPFAARQQLIVHSDGLTLAMSVENRAVEPAPLAFGHHPYFDKAGASLSFAAKRVWMNGENMLPTQAVVPAGPLDFSTTVWLGRHEVDHCYAGWDGRARIVWRGRLLGLDITSDMSAAIVYIPALGSSFCFEPVPHVNNALNLPNADPGMPVIEAGGTFRSNIKLTAFNCKPV